MVDGVDNIFFGQACLEKLNRGCALLAFVLHEHHEAYCPTMAQHAGSGRPTGIEIRGRTVDVCLLDVVVLRFGDPDVSPVCRVHASNRY